ncbi:cobalamin biosynthesis protein [uncultured Tateyamaria sp.]|uniref:cobalamin biosynthesis protein n=1 Tax=Tateyamaria sp. 1078 TaxID=3417464 RepID=UPI00262E95CE|nr:cobalamin biosynthesis protein [uncultured Tateyamaria sp.]
MIVAGFGFSTRATAQSLEEALRATGYVGPLDMVACPDDKALSDVMSDIARPRGLMINAVRPGKLEQAQTRTQSVISRLMRRTGSVAEAAALAAAGPDARLLHPRAISDDRLATCAIAQGAAT